MERIYFDAEKDGFYGAYFANAKASDRAMILMLGDAIDDRMAVSGVRWMHNQGCKLSAVIAQW